MMLTRNEFPQISVKSATRLLYLLKRHRIGGQIVFSLRFWRRTSSTAVFIQLK